MIHDDNERPVSRIATMMDITEAREAEDRLRLYTEKLARSELQLSHAQRIAKMGSFIHDLRTGHMDWSDETYRIYGVTRDNFVPTVEKVIALIHPQDRGIFADANLRARPNLGRFVSEQRIVYADGTTRLTRAEREVIVDAAGQPISVVGTIQDVTEQRASEAREKELERKLLHSQKLEALGTLAGGIAHDLNNTLVPILALSKLALEDQPEDSQLRDDLETIAQASERARDLVKQILAFSRKQEDGAKHEVDLAALTGEVLHMLRAGIPATIQIVENIAEVPPLLGDAGQLHQVIVNMVTNAAQAIGDRVGRIAVTLGIAAAPSGAGEQDDKAAICLSITDTGCGMDAATVGRIFEPFFTTKEVGSGTGLGLSVVHGIVTSHGGRIDVRSSPGEGTAFDVIFPIVNIEVGASNGLAA